MHLGQSFGWEDLRVAGHYGVRLQETQSEHLSQFEISNWHAFYFVYMKISFLLYNITIIFDHEMILLVLTGL